LAQAKRPLDGLASEAACRESLALCPKGCFVSEAGHGLLPCFPASSEAGAWDSSASEAGPSIAKQPPFCVACLECLKMVSFYKAQHGRV